MDSIMSIASSSMQMAQTELHTKVNASMLKKSMDLQKVQMDALLKVMTQIGQNVDTTA